MQNKPEVVYLIILGYGVDLYKLRNYLDYVVSCYKKLQIDHPKARIIIIPTGGYTMRHSMPNFCEALVIGDYLANNGIYVDCFEKAATTTRQNFEGVAEFLHDGIISPANEIYITADWCRSFKARIFCRYFLGRWPHVLSFQLTKSWLSKLIQLLIILPAEILALWWPWLEARQLAHRQKQIKNS